jgi:hypothetical protein
MSTQSYFEAKPGEELVWIPPRSDWVRTGVDGYTVDSVEHNRADIEKIVANSFGRKMKVVTKSTSELTEADCNYKK